MSDLCREIVTLQLGHYSNFIGAHWWNLQDAGQESDAVELQSDVLFRGGLSPAGHVTYTPRLIAVDLKGSLGSLRQDGRLYHTHTQSAVTWDEGIETHREDTESKNLFLQELEKLESDGTDLASPVPQRKSCVRAACGASGCHGVNTNLERLLKSYRLEGSVRVWSDYLRLHLHPRSISIINQYSEEGESGGLQTFGQGEALLRAQLLEDLEDQLHFFTEECDYLQGFQVFCDLSNGFSGLGSKVTEMLQDSYGGRGILTWGVAPVKDPETSSVQDVYQMMNCVLGTTNMSDHSSIFCPLTLRGGLGRHPPAPPNFPLLKGDPRMWYHSSAVLALALDCLTVWYRLRQSGATLCHLSDLLALGGRKVVSAYGSVPFPMMHSSCLPDALERFSDVLPWKPLSACPVPTDPHCFSQLVTLRGFEGQSLMSPLRGVSEPSGPLHLMESGEEVLSAFVRSHYPSAPLAVQLVSSRSKLTAPFPQFFSDALDSNGLILDSTTPTGSPPVVCGVPVLTCLHSGPAVGDQLSDLRSSCAALELRRCAPGFLREGPEAGEISEALERLRDLSGCYGARRSRSSSDGEDE